MKEWLRRLGYLLARSRRDAEVLADMEAHRAMMARPSHFGSSLRLREQARDVWGWCWLDDLGQDLRYAIRSLRAHQAFTAAALVTLALGIGATTAIFSVVSGLVLRPLPLAEPERLVRVHGSSALSPRGEAVNRLDAHRRAARSFDAMGGYEIGARYLRRGDTVQRVMTVRGEADFFRIIGTPAAAGRTFAPGDPLTVAVISDEFWRRELNAAPDAIGATLTLDDQPLTVIGVMPPSFQFPYGAASLLPGVAAEARTEIWTQFERPHPLGRVGNVIARLKPGVSLAAAESELKAIARHLETEFPETNGGRTVYLEPLADAVIAPPVRRVLFLLFGAVGLLLALACANVANLSLARMSMRGREVAVRAALGAARARLARQFLTESLVLSLAGGAIGLALAWWGTAELVRLTTPHLPRAREVGLDWRVFTFLLGLCSLTAVALGLGPALMADRDAGFSAPSALAAGARSTAPHASRRLRSGLVVAEVAIAFVLACGASMLIRELVRLRNTDSGMTTANVVTFHLGHRMTPQTDVRQFYDIESRVASLPGVRAAGFIQMLPLQNWGWTSNSSDFVVRGQPPLTPVFPIQLRYVTPGYFATLGIPITRGRGLTARDDPAAPRVILINETLARRYFGDADPTGQTTTRGLIAGVVADVRQENLDRPAVPEIYYPVAQNWSQLSELGMTLVVSTRDRPDGVIEPVRAAVREVNPALAVFNVKTMDRVIADSLSEFTLYLSLMAGFAVLALVLALTGSYGVIAYLASARTKEFAIRRALGADGGRVVRLVLTQGALLAALGLALGAVAAVLASPAVDGLPVDVRPPELVTAGPVALLIAVVAIVACLVPAVRAARVSPMAALREE
jgi:predicted permease